MKVVVLAGGLSPEWEVSLNSGAEICKALRNLGHQAVLVNVYLGVKANSTAELDAMFDEDAEISAAKIGASSPSIDDVKNQRVLAEGEEIFENAEIGPNVLQLCKLADIVFLALHGGIGENGKLQAMFDMFDIKYTGASSLASSLAMNKCIAKEIFIAKGVPATPYKIFRRGDDTALDNVGIKLPLVVKISSGGSSIGVYIAKTEKEYNEAINACFKMDDEVLVENYIEGREFAIPVLAGKALPVIEIIPENGWFDYEHKYQDNQTREVCPAEIPENLSTQLQRAAEYACQSLGIEVYARPDFLVDNQGNIFCIEVNTLPGMAPPSLFPKGAQAVGMSYKDLCQHIIDESLKRFR